MTNLNNLNIEQSTNQQKKYSKFVENTKRAVRNALVKTWIGVSSMMPMATPSIPTVVPASINTITAVAPMTTTIKAISLWAAAGLLTACGGGEDGPDTPIKPVEKDTTAPTIDVSISEVDITWWKEIKISGNKLYIWDKLVASRSDDKTANCNVSLTLNWKSITSWTILEENWTLSIKVSDWANNSKTATVKLQSNSPIFWLESLKNLNMQVDQEIDLLKWITLWNWVELVKTEIEMDGQKVEISDPKHYTPAYPWTCSIILIVKDKNWETKEYKVDQLNIKALEYKAMSINNIKPSDILPILKQAEWKADIKYLDIIKLAEATKIRDMMREYGAWNHTPEQYQQLMSRLNTGMMAESPIWYDNFETIGNDIPESSHAYNERNILNSIINHTNFKVVSWWTKLCNLAKENPNKINIIWLSMNSDVKKDQYNKWEMDYWKDQLKMKNLILLWAWTNIKKKDWTLINKIYQEKYDLPDEHSIYTSMSAAHNKNDNNLDTHILLTIWTNKDWDIDQTNETNDENSSKFPVWFHDKVLFSGRSFPYTNSDWHFQLESWKYATSYTNYTNVAMMDICFQMFAEAKDVDELLEMVRSTALTDYIRFDGFDPQPLQLINPAWFFQKYLMPTDTPSSLQSWKNTDLKKWYYKWVIFDIPWAEVKINWEWVEYSEKNKSLIKSQNPMNLQWRINWDLCKKMWYKWKDIQWKIIAVDDKWNGLNIDKNITINIK